jgi:hypothetical protein
MQLKFFGMMGLSVAMFGCNVTVTNGPCGEEPGGGGGCGAEWECLDGEWVDVSEPCGPEPEPSECPATFEEAVGPCFGDNVCEYPGTDEECGDPTKPRYVACLGGEWKYTSPRCSEPMECPATMPVVGTVCAEVQSVPFWSCPYSVACGDTTTEVVLSCDFANEPNLWTIESGTGCADCRDLGPAECGASAACQWLTPGCEAGAPVIEAGCYPTTDCQQTDGCEAGQACVLYSYNPCAGAECDACGATFGVCEDAALPPSP